MANILLNYQSKNLRYAVDELYSHNLYSWRALNNEFAIKTLIPLHDSIIENIDVYGDNRNDHAMRIKKFIKDKKIDKIFPIYIDMMFPYIYKELGFNDYQAEILGNKEKYTDVAKSVGIPTPNTYNDIKDVSYPIIAKPVNGTGSIGVKVLPTREDYEFFISGDIQYNDLEKYYIFQDFIKGPTISAAGRVVDGETIIDCSYNIEMSKLPFRAEIGFMFVPNDNLNKIICSLIDKLIKKLQLPTCAWMADFIYNKGTLFLVDFSPRLSVSAQTLIKYSAGIEYNRLVMDSILHKKTEKVNCVKSVCYRYFKIPIGEYNVSFNSNLDLADEICLPSENVYNTRMDVLMHFKGYAVTSGNSLVDAKKKWRKIANGIVLSNKGEIT